MEVSGCFIGAVPGRPSWSRRLKTEPPCGLKVEPRAETDFEMVGCGEVWRLASPSPHFILGAGAKHKWGVSRP